jgi:DNA-binding SARP family transcriptional activator
MICLLGNFRLLRQGEPVNFLVSGKALVLLTELALRLESGVSRDVLLEALWPGQDPLQSTVSLNSLVYSLQRHLRADLHDASAPVLVYANGRYSLNTGAGVTTDIARFDADCRCGTRLAVQGDDGAITTLRHAVELYRGDLAAGPNIYAVIERERLRVNYLSVLAWLATNAYQRGDDVAALDYALRLLATEPCREDAHRLVMRIHVRRGERAQALRQFQICTEVLLSEFAVGPEDQTRELFNKIRAGVDVR